MGGMEALIRSGAWSIHFVRFLPALIVAQSNQYSTQRAPPSIEAVTIRQKPASNLEPPDQENKNTFTRFAVVFDKPETDHKILPTKRALSTARLPYPLRGRNPATFAC